MLENKMNPSSYLPNGPVLHPTTDCQSEGYQPRSGQVFQYSTVKQEPIDEEKNDSGINSSSPESDRSENYTFSTTQGQNPNTVYYPNMNRAPPAFPGGQPIGYNSEFHSNPLTPPESEPLVSPKSETHDLDETLTCSSDESNEVNELEVPKISSSSSLSIDKKVKLNRCKNCPFVTEDKKEFWDHVATHIRPDKRLYCTTCNFVTEYKHHLEYHLRNHSGSKPFKCPHCSYTCVNKSMLNSHLKSHSSVYQYHCGDCSYATKYCHSLKLHLRKHKHEPGVILDQTGKPDPNPVIDVHGTRRGPRQRRSSNVSQSESQSPPPPPVGFNPFLQPPLGLFLLNQLQSSPDLASRLNHLYLQQHQQSASLNQILLQTKADANSSNQPSANSTITSQESVPEPEPESSDTGVLDLSRPSTSHSTPRNKRKGPAYRLIKPDPNLDQMEFDDEDKEENNNEVKQPSNNYNCDHCQMAFGDAVLYNLHMGLHCRNDPFTCNKCGMKCENRVEFYIHITRYPH